MAGEQRVDKSIEQLRKNWSSVEAFRRNAVYSDGLYMLRAYDDLLARLRAVEAERASHAPVKDGLVTYECHWHQEQQKTLGAWMEAQAEARRLREGVDVAVKAELALVAQWLDEVDGGRHLAMILREGGYKEE